MEYHKIQSIFKREFDKNKRMKFWDWARPEFQYLQNNMWIFTEKIDGTNIRVSYNNSVKRIDGKTDNSQIPSNLYRKIEERLPIEKLCNVFDPYSEVSDRTVILYFEGYGVKIQKGGNYIPNDVDIILLDIKIGPWWLKREDVGEIANELGVQIVPVVGVGDLHMMVDIVRSGFISKISHNREYVAEGIVARPTIELKTRSGERIITKLKYLDFPVEERGTTSAQNT